MPTRAPVRRSPKKPRAWRVTDRKPAPIWRRLAMPLIGVGAALAVGAGVLGATGVFRSINPQVTPSPTAPSSRQIVSSTLSGNTPTTTLTPLPVTPVPAIGAFDQQTPGLTIAAGPPVTVQQITPVTPPRTSAASAGGAPASAQPASSATARASITPSASQSMSDDLRSMNATATAMSQRAAFLSGSATPTTSGTPKATATDTPIPTAAPPSRPSV